MRHAGLVGLRRHDPYVVGQRARDFLAGFKARRMNAVIIGDQDAHCSYCHMRKRKSVTLRCARSAPRRATARAAHPSRPAFGGHLRMTEEVWFMPNARFSSARP